MTSGQDLSAALAVTPGTVTEFLEARAGEAVYADKLRHAPVPAGPADRLGVAEGGRLTDRIVVLRGVVSDRPFVYAHSVLAPDRLPDAVCVALGSGDAPIGRLLVAHGLPLQREALPPPPGLPAPADPVLADLVARAALARSYRIVVHDRPVIAVEEWFLPAVLEALPDR